MMGNRVDLKNIRLRIKDLQTLRDATLRSMRSSKKRVAIEEKIESNRVAHLELIRKRDQFDKKFIKVIDNIDRRLKILSLKAVNLAEELDKKNVKSENART